MVNIWHKFRSPSQDKTETIDSPPISEAAELETVLSEPEMDQITNKAHAHVELFSDLKIAGWAYYKGLSETPVKVLFYFDGVFVGSTIADKIRPDVKRAGHESEYCGFDFAPPPGRFERSQKIKVRTSSGQTIGNHPPILAKEPKPTNNGTNFDPNRSKPQKISLKEGKYYQCRNGEIIGPMLDAFDEWEGCLKTEATGDSLWLPTGVSKNVTPQRDAILEFDQAPWRAGKWHA